MNTPVCVLCAHYHPRADPHAPDRGQTCESGRRRLESDVMGLRSAYARLLEQADTEAGAKDAASQSLPAAAIPAPSAQPNVSGTREKTIPLTDVADLTAAAQTGSVTDPHRDQAGRHSVATILNEWVSAWHERYFTYQRRPAPTVDAMLDWLLGVRLELVCDAHEAITDFAAEISELRSVIRYHLDEDEPKKRPMWGVTCPRCDMMSQLMLDPYDPDKRRECANCGKMLTSDDYQAHLSMLVDQYRTGQDMARG